MRGGSSITYRVTREVRTAVGGGSCLSAVTHPAPNGEHVNTDVVKGWVKEYWAHEEQPQSGETPPERKTRIEALKAERTPGHHGKTCISAQTTAVVTEFFRLHTASDGDTPQSRPRRDVTSAYQR